MGEYGRFLHLESPLGNASVYVERFRGTIDCLKHIEAVKADMETIAEKCEDWLEYELGEDERWPELRSFLREPFRRDMVNLVIMFTTFDSLEAAAQDFDVDIKEKPEAAFSFVMRAGLFLVERGYLMPSKISDWIHLTAWTVRWAVKKNPFLLILFRVFSPPVPVASFFEGWQSQMQRDKFASLTRGNRRGRQSLISKITCWTMKG